MPSRRPPRPPSAAAAAIFQLSTSRLQGEIVPAFVADAGVRITPEMLNEYPMLDGLNLAK